MVNNRNIVLVTVLLLFAFMQILYPIPSPLPTNQLFLMLAMVLVLSRSRGADRIISSSCIFFFLAIVLSILSNHIPAFFKPWQRLMQFAFLFIAASPLFESLEINRVRRHLTMGVLWSCGLVAVLSFLAYVTGRGLYLGGIIQGYMGITAHPNFLGMFVMVAMVWFASLYFRSTENWERILWSGCWLFSLIVILLSASRNSTACGLLGTLSVVFLRFRQKGGKLFFTIVFLVLAFIVAFPYLMPYMETMMQKGVGSNTEETDQLVAATRGAVWELRLQEIKESPWVGVGAFSCDINLPDADVFYTESTGSMEQGSTYLGLLSQLGWVGFLCFMFIYLKVFLKAVKYAWRENTPYAQLMVSLLVPITVHMTFEGYGITAGAVQCVILWFLIGSASQCDKVADYPVLWEDEDPITPDEYVDYQQSCEED